MQTIPAGVWKEFNYVCMDFAPIRWSALHRMKISKNYLPSIILLDNKILGTWLPGARSSGVKAAGARNKRHARCVPKL